MRDTKTPAPFYHRLPCYDGVWEDKTFGTYWFTDGRGEHHGPFNTIIAARDERQRNLARFDVV